MNPRPLECHSSDLPADLSARYVLLCNYAQMHTDDKTSQSVTGGTIMDVEEILAELIPQVPQNVFTRWLSKRVSLTWLDDDDDRLGMTRFEEGNTELVRRRRLSLDPGEITIGLHPRLLEEPELLRHTLAHELIHASGVLNHSKELHDAVDQIAPGVSISNSPMLQEMREQFLKQARVKSWRCSNCGYEWKRATMAKPLRCHKCARPL